MRTHVFNWDANIDRQRYIGAVSRVCFTLGFTFLRFEVFECGGQRHEVAIFRNNLFAEALGLNPDYLQFTRRTPQITDVACEFVLVPEDTFRMGNPSDEDRRWDEGPQHQVNVPAFLMARTKVTQAVWRGLADLAGLDADPSRFENAGDRAPVERVSWNDVKTWLEAINGAHDLSLRLPSEAEWEYACRAGTTTPIYSGSMDIKGALNCPDLDPIAWYAGNSGVSYDGGWDSSGWTEKQHDHNRAGTHPVGKKLPNAFGLFDMIGDAWEWCEDRWHNDYDGAPTDGSAWTSGNSAYRVLRGGCWSYGARGCRSASRIWYSPDSRNGSLGFRPACLIGG